MWTYWILYIVENTSSLGERIIFVHWGHKKYNQQSDEKKDRYKGVWGNSVVNFLHKKMLYQPSCCFSLFGSLATWIHFTGPFHLSHFALWCSSCLIQTWHLGLLAFQMFCFHTYLSTRLNRISKERWISNFKELPMTYCAGEQRRCGLWGFNRVRLCSHLFSAEECYLAILILKWSLNTYTYKVLPKL